MQPRRLIPNLLLLVALLVQLVATPLSIAEARHPCRLGT
jgi:hypothetical protein